MLMSLRVCMHYDSLLLFPLQDGIVTMAFGRRYGLVGRNGTGKTTFLRHLAAHLIKGIPDNCQILHVEQEVRSSTLSLNLPLAQ